MATETANDTQPKFRRAVGMDMVPPFGVYLNGERVAVHDAVRDAHSHYDRLLAGGNEPVPAH